MKSVAQFSVGLERLAKSGDTRCRVSDAIFDEMSHIYQEGRGPTPFP